MKRFLKSTLTFCIFMVLLVGCSSRGGMTQRADALHMAGRADTLLNQGDYQNAMGCYIEVLALADKAGYDSLYVEALGKIGTLYAYHDDYQKAISYYERALEAARVRHFPTMPGKIVANLIMMNKAIGDKDQEAKYTDLLWVSPMEDKKEEKFYALYIPFLNHIENGEDDSIKVLFKRMNEFIEKNNYGLDQKALLYNHLGMRYMEKAEYDSALYCYKVAIRLLDKLPKASLRQAVYNNMCVLFKQLDKADSLTFYRGKMVEASDSAFNMRNFSLVKEKLDSYENERVERDMRNLRFRSTIASVLGVSVIIILIIIMVYSKKVEKARQIVVRRNETLLNENDELRRNIERLELRLRSSENEMEESIEPKADSGSSSEVSRRPALKEELQSRLATEIRAIMNDKTSVFNPDYNINMLALQLNTNVKYVSEAIHGLGASNFRNFINEYRIREACLRLSDQDNYGKLTIAAIARSVGFNSDNSFILAFKKVMGMTPARYRKYSNSEEHLISIS